MATSREELEGYQRRRDAVKKSYWGRRFVAEGAMTPERAQLAEREDAANMWHDRVNNPAEYQRLREPNGALQYVDGDDPELARMARENGEPTEFHLVCVRPLNLEQHQQLYQGVEREGMSAAAIEYERKEAWAERERLIAEAQGQIPDNRAADKFEASVADALASADGEEIGSPEWTHAFIAQRDIEEARDAEQRDEERRNKFMVRR